MQNPRLASVYAKSLLDIAKEQGSIETVLGDMQLIDKICAQSKDFVMMLRSPVIKGDKKASVINAVIGSNLQNVTQLFINLLVNKGRENVLPEIAPAFIKQYKEFKNIHTVKLTSAAPLDAGVRKIIDEKINSAFPGGTIEVESQINADLLGGFVLEVGDKYIDASVRRDLEDIKIQFSKNLYEADI